MKFVFEITIKPGHTEEDYVRAWNNGSTIIQKEQGALGTRLHRSIGEPHKLLAIATWESKALRDAAMEKLSHADPSTQDILNKHLLYGDIIDIGSFNEPEWIVEPERKS